MRNIIQDFKFVAGQRLKLDIPGSFFAILTGTDDVTVTLLKNNSPISHFENVKSGLTVEAKDFKNDATSFDSFVIVSSVTQTLKIAIGIDKFTYAKSSGLTEITGGTDNAASPPQVELIGGANNLATPPVVDARNSFVPRNKYFAQYLDSTPANASNYCLFNPVASGITMVIERLEIDMLGTGTITAKTLIAQVGILTPFNLNDQSLLFQAPTHKSLLYYQDVLDVQPWLIPAININVLVILSSVYGTYHALPVSMSFPSGTGIQINTGINAINRLSVIFAEY